jgi:hypothetical protein
MGLSFIKGRVSQINRVDLATDCGLRYDFLKWRWVARLKQGPDELFSVLGSIDADARRLDA